MRKVRKEKRTYVSNLEKLLISMEKVSQIFEDIRKERRKYLLEPEAKAVCMEYGIPVTKFRAGNLT